MTSVTACTPVPSARCFDTTTVIAAAVTIFCWASSFPAIRAGLGSFGPFELGAVRFAIAGVPAALFLAITRPKLPALSEIWRFCTGGLVFVAFYTVLLNMGERTVSSGAASFIINVNPIITAALAMAVLGERFSGWAWTGTAISFAGIGLIALGEGSGLKVDSGAWLVLGAAFCNSITSIVQKPLFARHGPLTVTAWNLMLGGLLLAPFLPNALVEAASASGEGLFGALYLALVPSLIAYATWATVLSRLPASRASNLMFSVPPISTLMGFLWLGEIPTMLGLVGGALALVGVVVVNLKR